MISSMHWRCTSTRSNLLLDPNKFDRAAARGQVVFQNAGLLRLPSHAAPVHE